MAGRQTAGGPLFVGSIPGRPPGDELMKRSLDSIAVRLEIDKGRFPELTKLEKRLPHHDAQRGLDRRLPDGDNFMQLLYGPNTQQSNNACYQSAGFDKLYEKSKTVPDGPDATSSTGHGAQDGSGYGLIMKRQPRSPTC